METIIIHWKGPFYDPKDIKDSYGLYLIAGKRRYGREDDIQYCGITERDFLARFSDTGHKIKYIQRDLRIWVGRVAFPLEIGRSQLEAAEKMIVYFWQPHLNDRKKITLPGPTTVISHWFKNDGTPRYRQQGVYRDLHDVISWDGHHWRTGNLTVSLNDE